VSTDRTCQGYNSFDDSPWIKTLVEYTAKVLAQDRVRIIGVCFGHQIVGRAMGVKVGRNPDGWESAVHDVQLTAKGKEIFQKDSLVRFCPFRTSLRRPHSINNLVQSLQFMHRDIVFYYPPGVEELGSNPVCKVQGMYTPKRLITVQGHPEFSEEIMVEILETRHKMGIFDDETFAGAMKRVVKPHDGLVVSKAFLRFLLDE
jgi:GMP synthase-like glutamine amidotransferase